VIAVLVNPKAGGGRAAQRFFRALRRKGWQVEGPLLMPESLEALGRQVASLLKQDCQRLVVVGGDGTFHRAVNALHQAGGLGSLTLGLVPVGTGSDLARTLGLPRQVLAAYELAATAEPQPVDVGLVAFAGQEVVFGNVASLGISGLVDQRVNANPRRGALAFLGATLAAVKTYKPVSCAVHVDGQLVFSGPLLLLACANGQSFGKGMRIAPQAHLADGLLEVVVVKAVGGWELVRRLPLVYLGRHLQLPQVCWRRGRKVEILAPGPLPPLDVDGECYWGENPTFRVLPKALSVAAPPWGKY